MFERVGVCSWSLKCATPSELITRVRACGVDAVQIALDPIRQDPKVWNLRQMLKVLEAEDIAVPSGMMTMKGEDYSTIESIKATGGFRPDSTWKANLEAAQVNAEIADQIGIGLVTFHVGFLPHDSGDPLWTKMRDRLLRIADCFAAFDISVALETGQEPASVLVEFLDDIDNPMIGVNFDPANVLLYGLGDPVSAFRDVAPFVDQMHIKDAIASTTPGEWGTEVVVGTGQVDFKALFAAAKEEDFLGNAMIEREAGESRVQDVKAARTYLEQMSVRAGA